MYSEMETSRQTKTHNENGTGKRKILLEIKSFEDARNVQGKQEGKRE